MAGARAARDGGRAVPGGLLARALAVAATDRPRHRAGAFFLLAAAAIVAAVLLRLPSRMDGLRRLDRYSGLPHRPATAIADEIATNSATSFGRAVARAYRARAAGRERPARPAQPAPRLAATTPLRCAPLSCAPGRHVLRGRQRPHAPHRRRLRLAGRDAAANFRVDAWVSPPPYTGKPPIILPGLRPGETVQRPRRWRCRPAARWSSARPGHASISQRQAVVEAAEIRRAERHQRRHRGAPLHHH